MFYNPDKFFGRLRAENGERFYFRASDVMQLSLLDFLNARSALDIEETLVTFSIKRLPTGKLAAGRVSWPQKGGQDPEPKEDAAPAGEADPGAEASKAAESAGEADSAPRIRRLRPWTPTARRTCAPGAARRTRCAATCCCGRRRRRATATRRARRTCCSSARP